MLQNLIKKKAQNINLIINLIKINFHKLNFHKRGDAGSNMFWILAMIAIAILVMIIIAVGSSGKLGQLFGGIGKQIEDLGDCDKDRVANMFDQCPCKSTDGVEDDTYRGCPKGIVEEEAKADKQSCNDDRCKEVEGQVIEVPEAATQGTATKADVVFGEAKVSGGGKEVALAPGGADQRVDLDFGGGEEGTISISGAVKNIGEEALSENIYGGVFVCPKKEAKNCKPTLLTGGETGKKAWVINGLFNDGQASTLPVQEFKIGADGDYCDGKSNANCYLRILVDSEDKFWEGAEKEKDNQLWLYVSVTNQKVTESSSAKKNKAIELVIDDDFGVADAQQMSIEQVCSGYIGDDGSDEFSCPSRGESCGDGEFPSITEKFEGKGCLVVVSEDDTSTNDCGYFGAEDGVIVDTGATNKISPVKTTFKDTTSSSDAHRALEYQWSSSPDFGSQLCKNGWWHQCDKSAENQMVILGEIRYRCEKTRWVKMD